ncbi:ATP-binding cassette domain-containing protein [Clostridiales bacterium COT073_COT-073]|nr:ATP-binding cassette domain-containing protein [Clostridiales bacterium COT073_COT-073]
MSENVIIKTSKLVHTYPTGVTALKSVDVEIKENEVVSIVGQNGSGKTTLVRHFNGLLKPTEGNIYLHGKDVTSQSVSQLSKEVGYVFQNPNHQIFSTTVRGELEVGPHNFQFSEQEIAKAIKEVSELMKIEEDLEKHPLTLDYTTKKIVTIASVLTFRPRILILDEPTGGLDQAGREILTKIIQMMKERGHTVIMISHDMDYVAENSERIIVMSQGRIIKEGAPQEVFLDEEILKQAQIEPPQIMQLDFALDVRKKRSTISVQDFVKKYKAQFPKQEGE